MPALPALSPWERRESSPPGRASRIVFPAIPGLVIRSDESYACRDLGRKDAIGIGSGLELWLLGSTVAVRRPRIAGIGDVPIFIHRLFQDRLLGIDLYGDLEDRGTRGC